MQLSIRDDGDFGHIVIQCADDQACLRSRLKITQDESGNRQFRLAPNSDDENPAREGGAQQLACIGYALELQNPEGSLCTEDGTAQSVRRWLEILALLPHLKCLRDCRLDLLAIYHNRKCRKWFQENFHNEPYGKLGSLLAKRLAQADPALEVDGIRGIIVSGLVDAPERGRILDYDSPALVELLQSYEEKFLQRGEKSRKEDAKALRGLISHGYKGLKSELESPTMTMNSLAAESLIVGNRFFAIASVHILGLLQRHLRLSDQEVSLYKVQFFPDEVFGMFCREFLRRIVRGPRQFEKDSPAMELLSQVPEPWTSAQVVSVFHSYAELHTRIKTSSDVASVEFNEEIHSPEEEEDLRDHDEIAERLCGILDRGLDASSLALAIAVLAAPRGKKVSWKHVARDVNSSSPEKLRDRWRKTVGPKALAVLKAELPTADEESLREYLRLPR